MLATLTSKGQITVPKEIRDRLQLDAGATLDFQLMPDNTIMVRAIRPDARRIRGLLKSPYDKPLTVEEMDQRLDDSIRKERRQPPRQRKPGR